MRIHRRSSRNYRASRNESYRNSIISSVVFMELLSVRRSQSLQGCTKGIGTEVVSINYYKLVRALQLTMDLTLSIDCHVCEQSRALL